MARQIAEKLKAEIAGLAVSPKLAIIQVGDRPESSLYIEKKKEFGEKIGAEVEHIKFPEDINQDCFENEVKKISDRPDFCGVIVQLPLPPGLNFGKVIDKVDFRKDVDGLSAINVKKLWNNEPDGLIPATAKAVLSLLDFYKIPLSGKRITIVGRSALVGKPTAVCLLNRGATVTIAHSQTENLSELTRQAEILVVAIGQPNFIGKDFVSPGQIVVDIGINSSQGDKLQEEISGKKTTGDVDFEAVREVVGAITPVPGGIGPLTVASLFENLLLARSLQYKSLIK